MTTSLLQIFAGKRIRNISVASINKTNGRLLDKLETTLLNRLCYSLSEKNYNKSTIYWKCQ